MLLNRFFTYKKARSRWIAAGRPLRSDEEIKRIYEDICFLCPKFKNGWCSICQCRLAAEGHTLNKIAWGTEQCPDEPCKWEATAYPTKQTVRELSQADKEEIQYEEGKPDITIPSAQARKKAQGGKPQAKGCC